RASGAKPASPCRRSSARSDLRAGHRPPAPARPGFIPRPATSYLVPMNSLRIALCPLRVHPGEPARNAAALLQHIEDLRGRADLAVFPELCVPGYFLGDAWERPAFLRDCEQWNERLIAATAPAGSPAIVFGTVTVDERVKGEDGRPRKYNAWVAAQHGRALGPPQS